MSEVEKDARLNRRLIHDRAGRQFLTNEDARWGELILPAPDENPAKSDQGLRILALASMALGHRAVKTVVEYERRYSDRVNLVGLVTDDPVDEGARIGLRTRMWKFLDEAQQLELMTATVEAALGFGVPVYTGEIKVDWFRRRAAEWRRDAILVSGFGQVIDAPIIALPPAGIYNFHPSDLAHHHGAGAAPYDDLVARGASTSVWTVHHVSEEIDAGAIVGQSPPVNVLDESGELPEEAMAVYNKLIDPLGYLVYFLVDSLAEKRRRGDPGPLERLDFPTLFPEAVKARMMEPIASHEILPPLADPDPGMFDPV